ncbi:MAG: SigE family RNA polymerase sigma factor [Dermatophilaceae bacterium]
MPHLAPDFDALVDARATSLMRLALLLTGNRADAEDLLQTALLRAYTQRARVLAAGAPSAYLRRILVNEHLRAGARPRPIPVADVDPGVVDARSPEERDAVWRLLATLPRQQRAVLVLRYYEDLPDTEIGEVLGIRPGTVRSTAHRGLIALRTRLATTSEGAAP